MHSGFREDSELRFSVRRREARIRNASARHGCGARLVPLPIPRTSAPHFLQGATLLTIAVEILDWL